ncbi:MAG: DUF2079 domain-containing protein [Victivallaceae bacterium]
MFAGEKKSFVLVYGLAAAILVAIAGYGLCKTFAECAYTDIVELTVVSRTFSPLNALYGIIPLEILLLVLLRTLSAKSFVRAFMPWGLMLPFFFFKTSIFGVIAVCALTGLTLFRLLLLRPLPQRAKWLPAATSWKWVVLMILATAAFVGQGIYISHQALVRQFFLFPDWGIFSEVAYNIFHRDFLWTYWYNINYFQHHFEPGFFLIFAPLVKLFPSAYTTFVFCALVLWGSTILIYWFARSRGLPAAWSCGLALIYLVYPSVSNMNLCILYGFHESYAFIPVFICFYLFYEKKKYWPAFFIFLFSLSMKETIGTLWIGWAVCQFISGERRWSIVYAVCSAVYFLLCVKVIIPAFAGINYLYVNEYYFTLGNSMSEMLLSPFTRPEAFFSTLFRLKNLKLILLLVLPVFMLGFNRPLVMCGCFVQLIFICLFSLPSFINLGFHHQAETVILFNCAAVLGLARIHDTGSSPWLRFIARGIPLSKERLQVSRALLLAAVITALMCNYFYAQSFYGCSSYAHVFTRPDYSPVMKEVKQIIPPDASVTAQLRPATQLVIRNRVYLAEGRRAPNQDTDYVFYDLGDSMPVSINYHKNMLQRKDYGLAWMKFFKGSQFFIFKRGEKTKFRSPLLKMDDAAWNSCGNSIQVPKFEKDFGVKLKLIKPENGRIAIQMFVRVLRTQVDYCNIFLRISDGKREYNWWMPFGYGFYPPFMAAVGDVFPVTIQAPPDWTNITSASVKFSIQK